MICYIVLVELYSHRNLTNTNNLLKLLTTLHKAFYINISFFWETVFIFKPTWNTIEICFVISQEFDTHKTFGLFSVCDVKVNKKTEYKIQTCKLFYSISYMPGYWVACCFFIGFSLLLITLVGVLGFASVCYRRVRGCSKSIFAVAGLMQAIAGLFWWIIFVFA